MKSGWSSLHNHTIESDGEFDCDSLIRLSEKYGANVVALTDHDVLQRDSTLLHLRGSHFEADWVSGVEISSGVTKPSSSVHILALFVSNSTAPELSDYLERVCEARKLRMENIVSGLVRKGFSLTVQEVMDFAKGESVALPHIVSALLSHKENVDLVTSLATEQAKLVDTPKEPKTGRACRRNIVKMMKSSTWKAANIVYPLLFCSGSAVKGCYEDMSMFATIEEIGKMVHNAGGVCLLAHPWTCTKIIDEELLCSFIVQGYLDGIELPLLNDSSSAEDKELYDRLLKLSKSTGCLTSMGPDAHNEKDIKTFAGHSQAREFSKDLVKRILASGRVSRTAVMMTSSLDPALCGNHLSAFCNFESVKAAFEEGFEEDFVSEEEEELEEELEEESD